METVRLNMGYTLNYAEKMDLINMTPRPELTSTGYCLAKPGFEYITYLPDSTMEVTIELSKSERDYQIEWLNPSDGEKESAGRASGGQKLSLPSPYAPGDAVLYLVVR
jgi:hypothetical protein